MKIFWGHFCICCLIKVQLHSLWVDNSFPRTFKKEMTYFLWNGHCTLLEIIDHVCETSFLEFIFYWCMCVSFTSSVLFLLLYLIVCFKTRGKCILALPFASLFSIVLSTQDFVWLNVNFRIISSICAKESIWILIGNVLNL